ncbi:hypothetical protein GV827_22755, partial [Sulfitobacter sp. JBTF-M27]
MAELHFDYVVIGAGSAGCVIANRLTEDEGCKVLLLEAGGEAKDPMIAMPGAAMKFWDTNIDWAFRTEPQKHLNNRRILLNRGKALGGSSTINWCLYVRGNPGDYDGWAQRGCTGWSYDAVLPYFRRAERNATIDDEWHGQDGPLNVGEFNERNPIQEMYLEAAEAMGLRRTQDFNGGSAEGCGYHQGTVRDGRRVSTADAYLTPILHRDNLTLETGAHITGLVTEGERVTGVDYVVGREARRALAGSETVLCAGAIGSPHILLLSGIGAADEIAPHGIDPVLDLPGVGRNLCDHASRPAVAFQVLDPEKWGFDNPSHEEAVRRFEADRTGPLSTMQIDVGAFVKLRPTDADPSAQMYMGLSTAERLRHEFPPMVTVFGYICRPQSRGTIRLDTASPFDAPLIDPNYYSEQDDLDRFCEIIEWNQELAAHPAFAPVRGEMLRSFSNREEIIAALRQEASTTWHQSGTCRMGSDSEAVVDPQLRLNGLDGLRICDASIMPEVTSGNTNAPTIMIAEKG